MDKKLSFKEYWDSKEALLQALKTLPKIVTEYSVKKYCKLPVIVESVKDKKDYISLKPKDTLKILWEFSVDNTVHVKSIIIDETSYKPCWNDDKFNRWVELTTVEILSDA